MFNFKIPLLTQLWMWFLGESIENKLIEACIFGKIENVKKFISYGAENINKAFSEAVRFNHIEIIKFLLSHPKLTLKNHKELSLLVAIEVNDVEFVKQLLSQEKINFNVKNWAGLNAIDLALVNMNSHSNEILTMIIKDPRLESRLKLQLVLDEKFFFTSRNSEKYKFVKQVIADCEANEDWETIVGNLVCLDEYFDVNDEYFDSETDDKHIVNSQIEKAQLLLQNPLVDPNVQDKTGNAALTYIRMGNIIDYQLEMVKVLLASPRIDVNIQNHAGESALFIAAERGDDEMVKLLLAHPNIKVNIQNNKGVTPLMASGWNKETKRMLLAHKDINLEIKDHKGKDFLDYQKAL